MTANAHTTAGTRWAIALLMAVTLVVYWSVCSAEFIDWDDPLTIRDNPRLNPPTLASLGHYWTHFDRGLYAPVTYSAWLGLAVLARVATGDGAFALNPWVFHSANLIVHVAAVLAAYALLRRLVTREVPALLGALLFAVHPMQLESVAWASGLKDVLAGCLGIVALWRYVVRAQRDTGWIPDVVGTISLVLAMLAKPSAAMVPLIAFGIDSLILRRPVARVARSIACWALLALPVLIVARIAQDVTTTMAAPLWSRPLIAADSLAFYLYKLIYPMWPAMDYGRRPSVVIERGWIGWTWIVPATALLSLLLLRKRAPWALGAAWVFAAALLPVLGLATFQFQFTSTVADHYVYLAMLGAAIALALLVKNRGLAARVIAACWLLLLAARTATLAPVWHDDDTLFHHVLKVNPDSVVALNNLGNAAMVKGDNTAALTYFQRAMAVSRDYPTPYENAARVLATMGDIDGSIRVIEQSIEIRAALPRSMYPNYMEDHYRVAQVLAARGRAAEAMAHLRALLGLRPDHREARRLLEELEAKRTVE